MQLRKMCAPPPTNKIVFSHEYAEKEGPFARGKAAPDALSPIPQPKGSVLLRTAQQVLEDVYGLDSMPEHDWRNLFSPGQVIPPSKWAPVIAYLKVLGTEIV